MKTQATYKTGQTVEWLLEQIEEFLTINYMQNDGYMFGWHATKDGSLVTRLRDGGDVTTKKMDHLLAFMQNPDKANLKPLTIKGRKLP